MPKQAGTTWLDLVIYAWASYFMIAIALGFPPILALWLLFPRWHRGRVSRRNARNLRVLHVAQDRHTVRTFR